MTNVRSPPPCREKSVEAWRSIGLHWPYCIVGNEKTYGPTSRYRRPTPAGERGVCDAASASLGRRNPKEQFAGKRGNIGCPCFSWGTKPRGKTRWRARHHRRRPSLPWGTKHRGQKKSFPWGTKTQGKKESFNKDNTQPSRVQSQKRNDKDDAQPPRLRRTKQAKPSVG